MLGQCDNLRDSAAYIIASPHLPSCTLQPRPHEMRTIEETRYFLAAPEERILELTQRRKRWEILFLDNDTASDLRAALRAQQGGKLCNDGLRSICWKVGGLYWLDANAVLILAAGFSAFRRRRTRTMGAKARRVARCIHRPSCPLLEVHRASR